MLKTMLLNYARRSFGLWLPETNFANPFGRFGVCPGGCCGVCTTGVTSLFSDDFSTDKDEWNINGNWSRNGSSEKLERIISSPTTNLSERGTFEWSPPTAENILLSLYSDVPSVSLPAYGASNHGKITLEIGYNASSTPRLQIWFFKQYISDVYSPYEITFLRYGLEWYTTGPNGTSIALYNGGTGEYWSDVDGDSMQLVIEDVAGDGELCNIYCYVDGGLSHTKSNFPMNVTDRSICGVASLLLSSYPGYFPSGTYEWDNVEWQSSY
jgi:hypothetical protein